MERQKIQTLQTTLLDLKEIAPDVYHFVLEAPENFHFTPGQFVSFVFDKDGKRIRRPYSIVSLPGSRELAFCIKVLEYGVLTPLLVQLKSGTPMTLLGPLGDFTIQKESLDKDLVFVSHGVGIAPLKSMIASLLQQGFSKNITLLTGYRTRDDVLYDSEFQSLEKQFPQFTYKVILSEDEDASKKGRVQRLVEEMVDQKAHYYLCGLKEMISETRQFLFRQGVPMASIYSEKFD